MSKGNAANATDNELEGGSWIFLRKARNWSSPGTR